MSKSIDNNSNTSPKRKPRIIFHMGGPGQSMEDHKKEMAEKYGSDFVKDESDMGIDDVKAMMAEMGMSMKDVEGLALEDGQKAKPGLLQRVKDAFWS